MVIGSTGNHSNGMAGHMGIEKTKSRILERALCYNFRNSCDEHVKGCAVCNGQKKGCIVARGNNSCFMLNMHYNRFILILWGL